jgi:hypothetical protein
MKVGKGSIANRERVNVFLRPTQRERERERERERVKRSYMHTEGDVEKQNIMCTAVKKRNCLPLLDQKKPQWQEEEECLKNEIKNTLHYAKCIPFVQYVNMCLMQFSAYF